MDKVRKDGKVAILISPGYGAGWYTWNSEVPQCLYSPEIIKMVEEQREIEITNEFCQKLFGVEYFYSGGASQLTIQWLDEGVLFRVDEYDGAESIMTIDDLDLKA